METTQEAIDKLAALAAPHEWLAQNGYQGRTYSAGRCPVAVYLKDKTEDQHIVNADQIINVAQYTTYSVPSVIRQLIQGFDAGQYPDLDIRNQSTGRP